MISFSGDSIQWVYILNLLNSIGYDRSKVAEELGVSNAMISKYTNKNYRYRLPTKSKGKKGLEYLLALLGFSDTSRYRTYNLHINITSWSMDRGYGTSFLNYYPGIRLDRVCDSTIHCTPSYFTDSTAIILGSPYQHSHIEPLLEEIFSLVDHQISFEYENTAIDLGYVTNVNNLRWKDQLYISSKEEIPSRKNEYLIHDYGIAFFINHDATYLLKEKKELDKAIIICGSHRISTAMGLSAAMNGDWIDTYDEKIKVIPFAVKAKQIGGNIFPVSINAISG